MFWFQFGLLREERFFVEVLEFTAVVVGPSISINRGGVEINQILCCIIIGEYCLKILLPNGILNY